MAPRRNDSGFEARRNERLERQRQARRDVFREQTVILDEIITETGSSEYPVEEETPLSIDINFADTPDMTRGVSRPPGWWRMRNGNFIQISEMELSHLQNTILMLRRSANARGRLASSPALVELERELVRRSSRDQRDVSTLAPHEVEYAVMGILRRIRMTFGWEFDLIGQRALRGYIETDRFQHIVTILIDNRRISPPQFSDTVSMVMGWRDEIFREILERRRIPRGIARQLAAVETQQRFDVEAQRMAEARQRAERAEAEAQQRAEAGQRENFQASLTPAGGRLFRAMVQRNPPVPNPNLTPEGEQARTISGMRAMAMIHDAVGLAGTGIDPDIAADVNRIFGVIRDGDSSAEVPEPPMPTGKRRIKSR